MAKVSTYLNFPRTTEEAFTFYKSVFGGDFVDGFHRFSEVPPQEGTPPLAESDKKLDEDEPVIKTVDAVKLLTINVSPNIVVPEIFPLCNISI